MYKEPAGPAIFAFIAMFLMVQCGLVWEERALISLRECLPFADPAVSQGLVSVKETTLSLTTLAELHKIR